jgi:hypothetical protein
MRITINDVRRAGFCAAGARRWCEHYGFDVRELLRHGLDLEAVAATGDAYAARVIAAKQDAEI